MFKSWFKIIFLIVISLNISVLSFSDIGWKNENYKIFTFKKFDKYQPANSKIDITNIDSHLLSAALFYATNKMRVFNNVIPLKFSNILRKAAYLQSYYMVKRNYFSSISPINAIKTLDVRIKKFGKYFGQAVENLAIEYGIKYNSGQKFYSRGKKNFYYQDGQRIPFHTYNSFAKKVVKQWMKSPSHRKIILDPSFTRLGAGAWFYYDNNGMLIAKISHCMAQRTSD